MQIIIPMSGAGYRFIEAGYSEIKPLIMVEGKPVIEHVITLFPGETNFIFICNNNYLETTNLKEILKKIAPNAKIIGIPMHKKGPVYTVSQAFHLINEDEETIVNYCDFSKFWDYHDFLRHTRARNADGAISAYRNFHPHMLGTTNYAFIRDDKQWMLQIQEKKPFTQNRMQEYASDGTYYFRQGRYVKKYFTQLMQGNINVNGEYYVSMVFNLMKKDNLKISIYEIQHMLQWGAPRDLEEYKRWVEYFRRIILPLENIKPQENSINLIPLAGRGNRFIAAGYKDPKPLIEISGKPMITQVVSYLPQATKNIFVCLAEHLHNYPLDEAIRQVCLGAKIIAIDRISEGQACTCEMGLEGEDVDSPLLIASCDNGMLWNANKYQDLIGDKKVDAVIWSFRHHSSSERNSQMYSWIKVDSDNNVLGVSVKEPISTDPYNDHAIVGTFYFKKVKYFLQSLKNIYNSNTRINKEFYVDSCINELLQMGLKVKVFEVDTYVCWGTPDDLKTYEYWQSFFHKCQWHPYNLNKDISVNKDKIHTLDIRYKKCSQPYQ